MVLTSQRPRQHVELRELSLLLLLSSLLPSRCVGPSNMEPSLGGPSSWALGVSIPSCPYSWASTCALWAGWPTARLPTLLSSLRQTVVMVKWA